MNIAFFLTPKSQVAWISEQSTMNEAIEFMEQHGYSAIPVLDSTGLYVGTLTEGDLLRKICAGHGMTVAQTKFVRLTDVPRKLRNQPVSVDAEIEELLSRAVKQNFVPVVDSRGAFIGIVRRRPIIEHCAGLIRSSSFPPSGAPSG